MDRNAVLLFSRSKAERVVDSVINSNNKNNNPDAASLVNSKCGLSLRRAANDDSWNRILQYAELSPNNDEDNQDMLQRFHTSKTPWFFGLEILDQNDDDDNNNNKTYDERLCGFVTFYIAYSSWNGKILHLDQIQCATMNEQLEKTILRKLANIAVAMDCARLTWTHKTTPDWHKEGENQPEMHEEVLTLCMNQDSMDAYVRTTFGETSVALPKERFSRAHVDESIQTVLAKVNANDSKFRLRLGTEEDVDVMSRLVHGLAMYVKEQDAVMLGREDYKRDGFLDNPLFYCLIIDTLDDNGKAVPCGFAFYFFGYQLGKGRFMHLEDLFIEEEYRLGGGGSLVMATLAQIGQSLDLSNFYWQALDWNTGALNFYKKIGAQIVDGLKTSRYGAHPSGALQQFAEAGPREKV